MAAVHPHSKPELQELGLALAYWQQWGEAMLGQFPHQATGPQALLDRLQAGEARGRALLVCDSAPLTGVVRRHLVTRGQVGPVTRVVERSEQLAGQVVSRARHPDDVPRSSWVRQAEVAWAIERSPALRQLVAPTSGSAMSLAADWLALFERWDWLLMAWRRLGSPLPETGAGQDSPVMQGLQGVLAVWLLYQALFSEEDLVFWLASRTDSAGSPSGADQADQADLVHLVSPGPPDALAVAQLVVLYGSLPSLAPMAWQKLGTTGPQGTPSLKPADCHQIWPELQDLAQGSLPSPSHWASLADRRQSFGESIQRVLGQQLRWVETSQLEQAAQSACEAIQSFLAQHPQQGRVAVVAADRLAARRLSALLVGHQIPLHDPSGWTLDTTVAASVVLGLFDLVSGQINRAGLMNWLSMPLVNGAFVAQGYYETDSRAALYQRLKKLVADDQAGLWDCLPRGVAEVLEQSMPLRSGERKTSIRRLNQALQDLGLWSALSNDSAGLALLSALQSVAMAMPTDDAMSQASTRASLLAALADFNMPLPSDEARVQLVGLMDAACGDFQQTIVLGAAQGQFPAQALSRLLDHGQMRLLRGEWPDAIHQAQFVSGLATLILSGQQVCLIAQREEPTQPVRWASALSRLMAVVQPVVEQWSDRDPLPGSSCGPRSDQMPRVQLRQMPEQISVSALSALPKCPYQFYWRAALGLDALEALEGQTEARDLGSLLHQILATGMQAPLEVQSDAQRLMSWFLDQWHAQAKRWPLAEAVEAELLARLEQASHWWASQAQAYEVVDVEQSGVVVLPRSGLRLKGRLDRLDRLRVTPSDGSGGLRILDYKTGSPDSLKERRRQDYSDLQLLAYARMQPAGSVMALGYLSLGASQVSLVSVDTSEDLLDQADETLARVAAGEPVLPLAAMGRGKACVDCPARHGCRARDWAAIGGGA
jgi:ATP-dependent helicase/nuclease subunit B